MRETQDIIKAYQEVKQAEAQAVLATVVKVRGSTYRRPGARMLIREDGTTVGAISSGCLEADVVERSKQVRETLEPITVVYDMIASDSDVWGLNLGCSGVMHILIEPIRLSVAAAHLNFIAECIHNQKLGVSATIFRVDGEFKAKVGTRLLVREDGTVAEDIKNPVLSAAILEDCLKALRSKQSGVREYRFLEGVVEAFIEFIRPPIPLLIFGAGPDAIPLARFAKELGWHVTVVDHRPAHATKENFPTVDALLVARPEEIADAVSLKPHSAAVILTHNFSHDLQLLRSLLPSPVRYLGVLGPSKRTGMLLEKLKEWGFTPSEKQRARLHCPVGLNIGGESPEEIALSILAEIQAFVSGRAAGFLKDHSGPIHGSPHDG